jgi:photosystem II stability/assembly factor-like uncharacterized protein
MEPQTVMADVGIAGGTGGVIRSRDGGTTWHTVLHGVVWWIEFDPLDPAVVYVVTRRDVLRSTDGGTHWSPLGIRDVHPATIHVDPTDDATLYVTPKWGTAVERSTDGGATWARFADGISGSFPSESVPTTSLLGPLGGAHALLVATQGGVFRSVRGADQWLPRRAGLPALSTRVVAVGSAGALAGTFSPGVVRKRGASWISSNRGIPVDDLHRFLIREITDMAVAPSDGDVVYAEDAFEGLFRSTNGGRSWTRVNRRNFGEGPSIAVDPRDPDHVFMAAFEGVFESTDGGATLQRRTVGLPSVDDVVTSIAFDPHDPMRLYGGGRHGTWASVDGGRHWHRSEDGLDHQWLDPVRVFPDPRHPDTVYVVDSRGVARSTDAGAHWTRLAGSPTDARSMAFDPARPRSLYVGVGRSPGVFLSRDAGATWHPFLGGCPGTDVGSLAIGRGAVANRLYAATSTGVFEAALSG